MADQTHCHFYRYSDELTKIYSRTGTRPFTWREIEDIIPCGTITRYSTPGYLVKARDKNRKSLRTPSGAALWQIPQDIAALCRRAIAEQDHRHENLAESLTGGMKCACE